MHAYNTLTIDLEAIKANINAFANHFSSNVRLMPMVKAAAYGTDAFAISSFYTSSCGIDIVGVSHPQEGADLREKGFAKSIFVIGAGVFDAQMLVHYDLEVAIDCLDLCLALNEEALKQKKILPVHVHLDTGMNRFGCSFEEALVLAEEIARLPGLMFVGIMTHFVASESAPFDPLSRSQSQQLEELLLALRKKGILPQWIHAANSAGALRFSLPFCNMVRVGLANFGIYSSLHERGILPLRPALTLESTILNINHCKKGQSVGYCQHYTVERPEERIAILPLGYHDGFHLQYSGRGYVLIHGKKAPFIGRICMDFMMVNITDIPEAKKGDPVLVFGKDSKGNNLPIEIVAGFANTNVRELLTSLGPRIKRHFMEKTDVTSTKELRKTVCALQEDPSAR